MTGSWTRAAAIAGLALVTLAGAPAQAARFTLFVFEPAFSGAGSNPCFDRRASDLQRLDLKKEITQAPGLPPMLTSCTVPAGYQAKATRPDMVVALYRKLGKRRRPVAPVAADGDVPFELVVLSGPTEGQESTYNRWYDGEHIPAVLANPGFSDAQRLKLVSYDAPSGYVLPSYGAWYRFRSADWSGIMAGIRRKLASGEVRSSTAFNYKTGVNRYYAVLP